MTGHLVPTVVGRGITGRAGAVGPTGPAGDRTFWPESEGAAADGTDDTTAILATIAAADTAGGGKVLFDTGSKTYGWTGTITIPDGVWLEGTGGQGAAGCLKALDETAKIQVGAWAGENHPGGLRNLRVDGDGTGDPDGLIQFQSVFAQMHNVYVSGGSGHGILLDAAQNALMDGVQSMNHDGAGIAITNGAGGFNFIACHFTGNAKTGIYVYDDNGSTGNAYPFGSAHLNFFGGICETRQDAESLVDIQAGATIQFWGTGISANGEHTLSLDAQVRINNAEFPTIATYVGFNNCNFNGGDNGYDAIRVEGNNTLTISGDTYYQQGNLVVVDGGLPFIRNLATFTQGAGAGDVVSAINGGATLNYFVDRYAPHRFPLTADNPFALITKRIDDAGQRFRIDRDGNRYYSDGTDATTKVQVGPDITNRAERYYHGLRASGRFIADRNQINVVGLGNAQDIDASTQPYKEIVLANGTSITSSTIINPVADQELTIAVWRESDGIVFTWPTNIDWTVDNAAPGNKAGFQVVRLHYRSSGRWQELSRSDSIATQSELDTAIAAARERWHAVMEPLGIPISNSHGLLELPITLANAVIYVNSATVGGTVTFRVDICPGTWSIRHYYSKLNNFGICKIEYSVDGGTNWVTAQNAIDQYAAATANGQTVDTTGVVIPAGVYTILMRFTSTGKNASSSAYYINAGESHFTRTA